MHTKHPTWCLTMQVTLGGRAGKFTSLVTMQVPCRHHEVTMGEVQVWGIIELWSQVWIPELLIHNILAPRAAQFFTASDPRFQALVDEWLEAGVIKSWAGNAIGTLRLDPPTSEPGATASQRPAETRFEPLPESAGTRYVACQGMRSLAKHMEGQIVREYGSLVEVSVG